MSKRVNARPHGIEFSDADWAHIQGRAVELGLSPMGLVNRIVGEHFKADGYKWDGLTTHGGKRKGAGRPPKSRGSQKIDNDLLDNQDAT